MHTLSFFIKVSSSPSHYLQIHLAIYFWNEALLSVYILQLFCLNVSFDLSLLLFILQTPFFSHLTKLLHFSSFRLLSMNCIVSDMMLVCVLIVLFSAKIPTYSLFDSEPAVSILHFFSWWFPSYIEESVLIKIYLSYFLASPSFFCFYLFKFFAMLFTQFLYSL